SRRRVPCGRARSRTGTAARSRPGPPSRTASPAVPGAGPGVAGRALRAREAPGPGAPGSGAPGDAVPAEAAAGVHAVADTRSRARPYLSLSADCGVSLVVSLPAEGRAIR